MRSADLTQTYVNRMLITRASLPLSVTNNYASAYVFTAWQALICGHLERLSKALAIQTC
jgi:hypothetical protein